MRASNIILVTLGLSLSATGCATKSGTGTAVGAGAGAGVGGLIGGWQGALIGGLAGGIVGYGVGRTMEEEDRRRAAYALEQNRAMAWENPQTGYDYRFEPRNTRRIDGRTCRDFRILGEVEGRPDEITGTACRRPDGSWQALEG